MGVPHVRTAAEQVSTGQGREATMLRAELIYLKVSIPCYDAGSKRHSSSKRYQNHLQARKRKILPSASPVRRRHIFRLLVFRGPLSRRLRRFLVLVVVRIVDDGHELIVRKLRPVFWLVHVISGKMVHVSCRLLCRVSPSPHLERQIVIAAPARPS